MSPLAPEDASTQPITAPHPGFVCEFRGVSRGAVADESLCGAALRATRAANTPAPKPLSMLTTVTPGAQELSIPSRAAIPPNEAP